MTTVQIPTNFSLPYFSESVELDGEVIDLTFFFNRRDDAWRMDVAKEGAILVRGIRLVTRFDLLKRYQYIDGMPQGVLRLVDLDQADADATEETFGDRVVLVYDLAA